MISLGIDIGGTSIKAAAHADGQWLWTGQSPFYTKPSTAALQEAIRAAVAGRLKSVDAIGLCVPGLLDMDKRIVTLAVNVPGLMGTSLDRLVPDALGVAFNRQAKILNDAGSTAHDIYHSRKLNGRLLVLTLGTGIGAAVLDDGIPLKVEGQSPGHIGQLDVSLTGEPPIGPDGGAGGLEAYLGVAALQKAHGQDLSSALPTLTGQEPAIRALVRAIRICHAIYRPHHICLAGGIGTRLTHLLPEIHRQVQTNLTSIARPDATLTTGQSDHHAARGAALLAATLSAHTPRSAAPSFLKQKQGF